MMPPAYVNVGAYVDEGTMIDSHALVGSCAQIGKRVHLSAAAQIGGVLEPVNASPVIIEDDVLVGGNTGVYEGTIVRSKAVLAAGTILTRGTPVYDLPNNTVLRATADTPLIIPAGRGRRSRLPRRPARPRQGPRPLRLHAHHRQIPRRKDRTVDRARRYPEVTGAREPRAVGCAYLLWRQSVIKLLLFCILLVVCWPAALLALVLYPFVWLVLLPFRLARHRRSRRL